MTAKGDSNRSAKIGEKLTLLIYNFLSKKKGTGLGEIGMGRSFVHMTMAEGSKTVGSSRIGVTN